MLPFMIAAFSVLEAADPAAGGAPTSSVALPEGSPVGEASIREHALAWHPAKECYYLVADVIPVGHPHHPNTYDTELHLWRSDDLHAWDLVGVVVPKGAPNSSYCAYGVASPAGMAYFNGKLYVPFSGRRTDRFDRRPIGLAWSGSDPADIPWTRTEAPVSDLPGEDDDPAVLTVPGDDRLHLYHRTTGGSGYRIAHTASGTPEDPASWPVAHDVTERPDGVRAQELTGAVWYDELVHLFVIEQGAGVKGIQIAHLVSEKPAGPFRQADAKQRYLEGQPANLAYGGHHTPVVRDGSLVGEFWTVWQTTTRYGLGGAVLNEKKD
ncbi:MAG: hypothetical protein GY851_16600 [bacterium]|nr:hypothetical protein [bacterium]